MLIAKLGLTCPKRLLTNLRAISNPNQILFANKSLFSLLKRDPINSTDSAQSSVPLDKYIKGEKTIETLQKKGINSFFPIQTKTYDYIYNGRDVIAGDKTGSGKTIAFTLPVIERLRHEQQLSNNQGIKFVVLAPTRELAVQIGAEINSLKNNRDDFQVITVYGGIPIGVNERQLTKNPDVLVGTPGRIMDLIERGLLNLNHVKVVCIDEADFMFDIGFQSKIDEILTSIKNKCEEFQLLCFTATLSNQIVGLTKKFMNKDKIEIKMEKDDSVPSSIEHFGINLSKQDKLLAVRHLIANKANNGRVIIFTNTKNDATTLSQNLNMRNVLLHGDIEQHKRLERLKLFKSGVIKVLIATDVAARGLDIPNVQLVINYQLPSNYQSYVHRSGRTGRAGKQGLSIALASYPNQTKQFLKMLHSKTSIKLKKMEISAQQYQVAETISQSEFKQDVSDELISPTQLILFDRRGQVTTNSVKQFLQQKGKHFSFVKQITSRKTGNKFYIIKFNDQKIAKETLQLRMPINKETGQFYLSFQQKKQRVQPNNNQTISQ